MTQEKQPRLDLPPQYLALMATPFVLFFVLDLILAAFGDPTVDLQITEFSQNSQGIELIGRYRMMSAGILSAAVAISILLIYVINLKIGFSPKVWAYAGGVLVIGGIIGIGISQYSPEWLLDGGSSARIDGNFFATALSKGNVAMCLTDKIDCGDSGAAWVKAKISDPIDGLVAFTAPCVLFGMILAIGAVPKGRTTPQGLARGHDILQRYLYLSGLLLTAGLIFMISWMRWPQDMIADPATKIVYSDLVGSISIYVGTGFSLVILSVYLPVMLILRQRSENLPDDVEIAHGYQPTSYVQGLKSIVAILSPVIAGSLGELGTAFAIV